MTNLGSVLKSRDILIHANKVLYSQSHGFSSSHVCMWKLDHKEGWASKHDALNCGTEKTLEEIKPINPKGNQSLIFIGRTDTEAEASILWPHDAKNWHWKRPLCWEKLKAGGEEDDRGWVGWMASLTQWTWVWTSSRRWWRTGKPSVLQSVDSQSDVTSDWTTKTARLFKSDSQSIDASASASVLPIYSQSWFPLGLTGLISLLSEWLSRVFPKPQKHHFCVCVCAQPALWSNSHIHTWLLEKP